MGRAVTAAGVEEDAGGHPLEESMGIQTAEAGLGEHGMDALSDALREHRALRWLDG